MQIVVLSTEAQRKELMKEETSVNVVWITTEGALLQHKHADAFLDLTFVNTVERNDILQQLLPKPVIVNSVTDTLAEIHPAFIRINGWPTFLSSPLIEAACRNEEQKAGAENVFTAFNKGLQWLEDEPGFIAARVVSMIINEAFIALAEGVSTKEEMDTAMKLGTAYPYGPFEWAEKIGVRNVVALLEKLSGEQKRYQPAKLLVQEVIKTD